MARTLTRIDADQQAIGTVSERGMAGGRRWLRAGVLLALDAGLFGLRHASPA